MNKFLMVTVSFPPMTGAGTFRPSRLAKYLPLFNWQPIIITMRASGSSAAHGDHSQSYANVVFRTPSFDPAIPYAKVKLFYRRLVNFFQTHHEDNIIVSWKMHSSNQRIASRFLIPDIRVFWFPGALIAGIVALLRYNIKVLYSTSPSAHLVACVLSLIFKLPFIVEFRDPWIANPFRHPRSIAWLEHLDQMLEKMVIMRSNHIIVTSSRYRDDFLAFYKELSADKISFIPNGYDPADFENLIPHRYDKTTIVHIGNFYDARSSLIFLKALSSILDASPALASIMQAVFVGNLDPAGMQFIEDGHLSDVIIVKGQLNHADALRFMCGADALLLIPGPGEGTMPGKTYEYMRACKPIFCLADEGPAKDLINHAGIGMVVSTNDEGNIAYSLRKFIDSIVTKSFNYPDISTLLITYDRREIARKTSDILNNISNKSLHS